MAITTAYFDLETSSLNANFGIILCAVIAESGKKPIVLRGDVLCPDWDARRSDDSAVVRAVAEELIRYDLLVAHNGLNFDVPFLRTRLARHKMGIFPEKKLIDPYQLAKRKFRMSSNALRSLADMFGFNEKTPVAGALWMAAYLDGDRRAMDEIVEHCVADVRMLEALTDQVKGYATQLNARGSAW